MRGNRQTREEYFEDALPEPDTGEDSSGSGTGGGEENESHAHGEGSDPSPGEDRPGTFTALDERGVSELNQLFRLLHDHGYMTAGKYSVLGDGSGNLTISLTVMPPSSGGLPRDAFGARDDDDDPAAQSPDTGTEADHG
jgi:hypothetical protein